MAFSKIILYGGTHCQTLAATFDHLSLFFFLHWVAFLHLLFFSFSFHTRWLLFLPSDLGFFFFFSFFFFFHWVRWSDFFFLLLLSLGFVIWSGFLFFTGFGDTEEKKKKKTAPTDRYGTHKQYEKYWVMTSEWWCQTDRVFWVMSDEWWMTEIEWWKLLNQTWPKPLREMKVLGWEKPNFFCLEFINQQHPNLLCYWVWSK